jgi:hypothetical protein
MQILPEFDPHLIVGVTHIRKSFLAKNHLQFLAFA